MFHSLYNRAAGLAAIPNADGKTSAQEAKSLPPWPANYLDSFDTVDPEHWQLEVDGLLERPQAFTLKDISTFMRVQQNRRLVFADGWTCRASWEGFVFSELLHRVGPKPEAQYLIQTNMAGQRECLPIRDLLSNRALFCLRAEGRNLPPLYGGPLRLLAFDRYAHKGLGQLTRLEFTDQPIPGFFADKGYHPDGQIEPGNYYCADLKIVQTIRTPGEVTQW